MNPKGKVLLLYILWENFLLALHLFKGTGLIPVSRKYTISPTVVKWPSHKMVSQQSKFYFNNYGRRLM